MKWEGMKKGRELPEKLCTFCGGARVVVSYQATAHESGACVCVLNLHVSIHNFKQAAELFINLIRC